MNSECETFGEHALECICATHPWQEYLNARMKVILWMSNEMKRPHEDIAKALSMDTQQAYLVRIYAESILGNITQ